MAQHLKNKSFVAPILQQLGSGSTTRLEKTRASNSSQWISNAYICENKHHSNSKLINKWVSKQSACTINYWTNYRVKDVHGKTVGSKIWFVCDIFVVQLSTYRGSLWISFVLFRNVMKQTCFFRVCRFLRISDVIFVLSFGYDMSCLIYF